MITLLALTLDADAGKLVEGFRGLPYGSAAVLDTPPLAGCLPMTESGVRWTCQATIGATNVVIYYMTTEGLYHGNVIEVRGYTEASALFDTLRAGWGKGQKTEQIDTPLPDWLWVDVPVYATWEYNQFSQVGKAVILHRTYYEQARESLKIKAQSAAQDDL